MPNCVLINLHMYDLTILLLVVSDGRGYHNIPTILAATPVILYAHDQHMVGSLAKKC